MIWYVIGSIPLILFIISIVKSWTEYNKKAFEDFIWIIFNPSK